MRSLRLKLSQNEYEIQIGSGLLEQAAATLTALGLRGQVVIISDPTVRKLYAESLRAKLEGAGFKASILEVPAGEEHKSLEQAGRLYTQLAELGAERLTPIIALGGGVIGDLAGFVAASYMRGVPVIQAPTTLLAQVDSSIGGKTAVDHGRLKNRVGFFYQPRAVIADLASLRTLPERELENGLAECIKYAVIQDPALLDLIDGQMPAIRARAERVLEEIVYRCAAIKAALVEKDERDLGLRNILNLGHTTGHAVESVSNLRVSHGRGVAIGLVTAALISNKMGILKAPELARIKQVIQKAGLPLKLPAELDITSILEAMRHDKKKLADKVRFILPEAIGRVFVQPEVSPALLEEVLREQRG